MNNILELIRNEEVKWVKLGDVCEIKSGQNISKMDIEKNKGIYPVINSGKDPLGFFNKWNTENDPIGITTRGAGVGSITYQEGKYFRGSLNYSVTVKDKDFLFHKFLYYLLNNMQSNIHKLCNFNGIPALNSSSLKELDIPIPSLELQEKIVKILDKYTDAYTKLQAALKKEIELRIKQYEYYRDKLLSEEYLIKKTKELCGEDAKVEVKTLNEIGIVTKLAGYEFTEYVKYSDEGNIIALRGLNVKKGSLVLDDVKYIDNSKLEKLNRSKLYIDDILYTYVGTVGEVALIDKNDKYYLAPNVALIRINDKNSVLSKYILYYLQSNSFKYNQLNKLLSVSSMKNLTMEKIRLFKIPIAPLEVQTHISSILDKYTSSYLQLQSTLSKEIEFRTKQYEYYREKLLNFKK